LSLGESRGIFFATDPCADHAGEFVWHLPHNIMSSQRCTVALVCAALILPHNIDSAALIRSGEKNILKKNIK